MENIALTIHIPHVNQEILNFLKRFSTEDLELTTLEDIQDLQLLQNTRHEDTISACL